MSAVALKTHPCRKGIFGGVVTPAAKDEAQNLRSSRAAAKGEEESHNGSLGFLPNSESITVLSSLIK